MGMGKKGAEQQSFVAALGQCPKSRAVCFSFQSSAFNFLSKKLMCSCTGGEDWLPCALPTPVQMLARISRLLVFSPSGFVIRNCGSLCPSAFNPRLTSCFSRADEWFGLVACVSVRPRQHFPGAGLVPAHPTLPSIVHSVLRVRELVVEVFQWEGDLLLLSLLLCLLVSFVLS